jgi:DNA-binding response OmpR family regulator
MAEMRINVLLVEDNPADAELVNWALARPSAQCFVLTHVSRLTDGIERLNAGLPDVILLDLSLPDSVGMDTIRKMDSVAPTVPIVVFTGLHDEDVGIQALHYGAQDYLVKDEFNERLLRRVIRHAIERKRLQIETQRLILELHEAKIKILSGLLPICASCKKIRDDKSYWKQVEVYIQEHSDAEFTHSICPDCLKKYQEQMEADAPLA